MNDRDELLAAAVAGLGGSRRAGQERMAAAVTKALDSSRHLAVQAGTGTGKSLAYLVPAIRYAQEHDTAVVVSTATLALQRQLVKRDLPRLADALDGHLDHKPTFAILKGRSNYACLNKLARDEALPEEALLDETAVSRTGAQVKRIYEWAGDSDTGDRDDLEPGVSDLAWKQASVSAQECLGAARCPHGEECFAELARAKAADVDIVVTNHAMLAIDALSEANILPAHSAVIVDEAHELDARITGVATATLSQRSLKLAAKRTRTLGSEKEASEIEEQAVELDATVEELPAGRWLAVKSTEEETAASQLEGLGKTLARAREAVGRQPEGEAANDPEKAAERYNLSNLLAEMGETVMRILDVFDTGDPADSDDVVWVDKSEHTRGVSVAPLSVADTLRNSLFSDNTVVLTSATLALGGRFDAMAAAWGLPDGKWDSLDAGTPFDPGKSGILYTARHLPTPGRDGLAEETLQEIAELLTAAGGRTLGLFSSRRAADQAADAMRQRTPFEILRQGEDSIGTLVQKFSDHENACLFGTLSLWQGVDVPGSACSLVLIDRIPFPRPDDPLLQARADAAKAAGRNGFMEVSATHAALLMAQGAGRLLRSATDRGVVAVLDNRLETKRYGGFLKASLPPFWQTTNPDTVRGALRRLAQAATAPRT